MWIGYLTPLGYGLYMRDYAHRISCREARGPNP